MHKSQNRRLVLIVLISILIHVALFTLVLVGARKPISPAEKPSIVQAELVFVDTANFLPTDEEISDVQVSKKESESLPLESETAETQQVPSEPPSEPQKEIPDQELSTEDEQQDTVFPQAEVTEEEARSADESEPNQQEQESIQAVASKPEKENIYSKPVQDIAKSQLQQYQQNRLNSLAVQAAKEYRESREHPSIDKPSSDPFLSEEEKFSRKITTNVDCSSTTNQTLAVVMGIMGGRVKCSEPPPFDSFIQRRLNKVDQLPAMEDLKKQN